MENWQANVYVKSNRMISASRIKELIENRSGLSLGDALNVAMFLLTAFSLVVAAVSVEIAIKTYKSADEGGKQQLDALKGASNTLEEQTAALKNANQVLGDLLDQSREQLGASKNQLAASKQLVDEMNRGLQTAKDQLDLAKQETEHRKNLENRRPRVSIRIGCSNADNPPRDGFLPWDRSPNPEPETGGFNPGPSNFLFPAMPTIHVKKVAKVFEGGYRVYTCVVRINNDGDISVEDGFMHVSWSSLEPPDALSHSVGARVPNYDDFVPDTPWHPGGLVLFDKAKIYANYFPDSYRFQLRFPDQLKSLVLNYHIVGSNYPRRDGSIRIDQGEEPKDVGDEK